MISWYLYCSMVSSSIDCNHNCSYCKLVSYYSYSLVSYYSSKLVGCLCSDTAYHIDLFQWLVLLKMDYIIEYLCFGFLPIMRYSLLLIYLLYQLTLSIQFIYHSIHHLYHYHLGYHSVMIYNYTILYD